MRAFVVRHGNTFAAHEPPRRIGAATDLPLVPSGRQQAVDLAAHFASRDIVFARCLCSPLLRTRKTAALLAPALPAEPAEWLREIDHGPDEGQPEAAVAARIGQAALAAWERDATPPPGWHVDAPVRIAAWRAFLASEANGNILLVTSNGAARFALIALGLAPAKLRTGAYGEIVDGRVIAWDVRPGDRL